MPDRPTSSPDTGVVARNPFLVIAALIGLVAYGALLVLDRTTGTLRDSTTPTTVVWILVATVGFGLAVWSVERGGDDDRTPSIAWLWLPPIVFRLLLLATDPALSDDVFRYLWDGHLWTEGVSPYRHAISAPEFDRFDIPARDLANNRDLASPYLPTSQFVFFAVAAVGGGTLAMQIVMTCFDLATGVVLQRLLGAAGLPTRRIVLYLWNPLVIVEIAHGAHFDAVMVFLTMAALLAVVRRPAASPVLLALATLTRPIPLLLAPVLWWRWTWAQRIGFGSALVVLVAPFRIGAGGWGLFGPPSGNGLFGSARVYTQEFRFNAVTATWLERWSDGRGLELSAVIAVSTAVALLLVWWLAGRDDRLRTPMAAGEGAVDEGVADPIALRRLIRWCLVPVLVYVVLTPVLHPWYLIIVVTVAAFVTPGSDESCLRWLIPAPLWYLAATAPVSYLTYEDPLNFGERDWIRRLEWWPTLLLSVAVVIGAIVVNRSGSPNAGRGD